MRQKISRKEHRFLSEVLDQSVDRGLIETTQKKDILTYYEPSQGLEFIKVLGTVGSVLIGLGILLLIASNWNLIAPVFQLLLLLALLGSSLVTSSLLAKTRPITSQAFLYLAVLIYGASLFLIDIGFNFNIAARDLFFVWAVGTIVLSTLQKDILLFLASHVLAIIFIFSTFDDPVFLQMGFFLAVFFGGNYYYQYRKVVTFATLGVTTLFLIYTLNYFDAPSGFIALSVFALGLGMYNIKHELNFDIFQLVGLLNFGIAGFTLSFPNQWQSFNFIDVGEWVSVPFTLALIVYALYLTSKRQVVPLVLVSSLILRFYFDTFFNFLNRALFFIIGGLLVLALGYVIERLRKSGGH